MAGDSFRVKISTSEHLSKVLGPRSCQMPPCFIKLIDTYCALPFPPPPPLLSARNCCSKESIGGCLKRASKNLRRFHERPTRRGSMALHRLRSHCTKRTASRNRLLASKHQQKLSFLLLEASDPMNRSWWADRMTAKSKDWNSDPGGGRSVDLLFPPLSSRPRKQAFSSLHLSFFKLGGL